MKLSKGLDGEDLLAKSLNGVQKVMIDGKDRLSLPLSE